MLVGKETEEFYSSSNLQACSECREHFLPSALMHPGPDFRLQSFSLCFDRNTLTASWINQGCKSRVHSSQMDLIETSVIRTTHSYGYQTSCFPRTCPHLTSCPGCFL
uniref:Uncharacterized protein n=1 Tax=Stegastes partitus TaxID=144197 RepID=A0A3B5AYI8_9TELE